MSSILHPVLSTLNQHERDKNISFQEEGHKYTIFSDPDSKYTSTTTWIHSHFPHFDADKVIKRMMKGKNWNPDNKYWGMTADQIKQLWSDNGSSVSGAGTEMHFNIECFMNNPTLSHPYTHADLLADYNNMFKKELKEKLAQSQTPEWKFFLKYIEDHPDMKPYRTEWTIYDEDIKLTGSIDMVYEKPDGTLAIYDWKRSKDITRVNNFNEYALTPCISHMPNSNFWHYSLQLNIYKQVLQRKYGKQVSELCLVRLHPDATEETYELISVPDLSKDVDELFKIKEEEQRSV
jgi:ATP-dependent exoDNAse (exonuclease V) beta subunit